MQSISACTIHIFKTFLRIEVENVFCINLNYLKCNSEILKACGASQINMTSIKMVTHIFVGQAS